MSMTGIGFIAAVANAAMGIGSGANLNAHIVIKLGHDQPDTSSRLS